ncbi:hypothetical protein ACLB2K_055366 [Fragaria x ananassa]
MIDGLETIKLRAWSWSAGEDEKVALEINRSLQLVSKMEDEKLQESKKWLHYLSTGAKGINELEALTLIGLQVLNAHKGFFHCNFIVPDHLSDQDGNWHVGAIATMIDDVGAAALIPDEFHAGKSDKEIYKKLEEDFGETVLYAPKFDLQTADLWLSPVN